MVISFLSRSSARSSANLQIKSTSSRVNLYIILDADLFTARIIFCTSNSSSTSATNDIIVYPSEEKVFKFYYIYDDLEDSYKGVKLEQHKDDGIYSYTITDGKLIDLPKSIHFYDFFTNHPVKREAVEERVNEKGFLKKLGSIFSNK